jgi:hypothetical protein
MAPPNPTRPAHAPSANARRHVDDAADVDTATTSGANAIHANAGCPNFGKLAANRTPERSASG